MARELQRHPVRGSVTHVDFQVVDPNREVTAEVTITLTGEALELHRADGVLEQQMFSLTIKSRPADIPAHLEVDITDLVIGSAVRVSDIALPANVITEVDPESIVAAGQAPRVQAVEEGEGVEGEAAEGEAAEGEAGAAGGETRRPTAGASRAGRANPCGACCPRPAGGRRPTCWWWASATRERNSSGPVTTSAPRSSSCWRRGTASGCGPRRGLGPSSASPGSTVSSWCWPCPRRT